MTLCREEGFPKDILEKGFAVDMFNSRASVKIDHIRIFNLICGVEAEHLDEVVPQQDHPNILALNAALGALFAEAALSVDAQAGEIERAVEVLVKDTTRRSVRLDIPVANITNLDALAPAFNAWPYFGDSEPGLTKIDLDATASETLTDIRALNGLRRCIMLNTVQLNFTHCTKLRDIRELGQTVGALQGLRILQLDFTFCKRLRDVAELGRGLGAAQNLQHPDRNL